ncbi:hypothetical protein BLJ79_14550 [Arthrobacter sp. UCD-GKA]|nr:hypothetical protein BLJ79_14550 [Arthrobacter sp. UCD-GKA]
MAGLTGIGERVNSMMELSWHAEISNNAEVSGQSIFAELLGDSPRRQGLRELQTALGDAQTSSIVLLGEHGDDRAPLVRAIQRNDLGRAEPIHVIGTPYAQHLTYGALAFLLAQLEANEEISPANVMRVISKHVTTHGQRPVVVVQYPRLLDAQSRAVLAQMTHNRSILLVVLTEQAEFLPPEFAPVSSGRGHREIRLGALRIDEVQAALQKEFDAVPTPMATAAMWRQSQGNPGWLHALGQDAIASGKLLVHEGHLVLGPRPWPRDGQLESMALSQIAILTVSQRNLLERIAVEQPMHIRGLANDELMDLDHLIGWGFAQRDREHRQLVVLSSQLLAGVLHPESRVDVHGGDAGSLSVEGNFHDFIAGESRVVNELSNSSEDSARNLGALLVQLRKCLLCGEMQRANAYLKCIVNEFLENISPALFELLVMVNCILNIVGDRPGNDRKVLESVLAQFEQDDAGHDRWLVKSMLFHLRTKDEPASCNALDFQERWSKARWWFSDLLASVDADASAVSLNGSPLRGSTKCETMDALVALHHGATIDGPPPAHAHPAAESNVAKAIDLLLAGTNGNREKSVLDALDLLVGDDLSIFALPRSNRILAGISVAGRLAVAGWLKQRRKGNAVRSGTEDVELMMRDNPVLEVLTKREKFVASAAAQGMNNQQIARDAGVSIRTVEGHLYQIYSKLALGGRRELSTLVATLRVDDRVAP